MPIDPQYPSGLDDTITLPEPNSGSFDDDVGMEHDLLHAAESIILKALERKVGIDNSLDVTSIERILKVIHNHDGGNSAAVDYTDLASVPSTFAPANHTDSVHSDGPNVKQSIIDQQGDLLVGSAADALARLPIGALGQVLQVIAGSNKVGWVTPASVSGVTFGHVDVLVKKESGLWKARDLRTQSDIASNADFATVVNTASATFVDPDTGQTLNDGGSIHIARPASGQEEGGVKGGILVTTPILMRTGMSLTASGKSTRLIASGNGMKNVPVISGRDKNRLIVDNFSIDCNSVLGASGVQTNPSDSAVDPVTGGPNSYTIISRLDITNFTPDTTYPFAANFTDTDPRRGGEGIAVGKFGDTGATANTWLIQNHVYGGGAGSIICALHQGDAQVFWNNFHHISTTGLGVFVDSGGSHVKFNHVAQSGVGTPYGNVYLNSGPNTKVMGNYLDNVIDGPAVNIVPATGASVGAPQVIGNWSNGTMTTDAVTPFVKVDVSGGSTANGVILDNVGEGGSATQRFKAIIETPASSEIYYKVANNHFRYTRFIYSGKKPFGLGRNSVQTGSNNNTNYMLEDRVQSVVLASTVTVANTAAETDLLALVIPADSLDVGSTYMFELYGSSDNIATSGPFKWRVKANAVIVAEAQFPSEGSSQSGKEWTARGLITIQAKGSSGTVAAAIEVRSDFAADTKMNTGTGSIDTTLQRTLSIACDMDTADAGNVIRAKMGRIELVKVAN